MRRHGRMVGWAVLAWVLPCVWLTTAAQDSAPLRADDRGARASFESGSLRIDFDQAMRTFDNAADVAVTLSPALPVRCHWASDVRLSCAVVEGKPTPATRYTVRVQQPLLTATGAALRVPVLTVETARPELSAFVSGWRDGVPAARISATLPVTPDALRAALRLRVNGTDTALPPVVAETSGYGVGSVFRLDLSSVSGKDSIVELQAIPGLATVEGPLRGIQDTRLLHLRMREPARLASVSCQRDAADWIDGDTPRTLRCPAGRNLQLLLTAPPDPASLAAMQARLPAGTRVAIPKDEYLRTTSHRTRAPSRHTPRAPQDGRPQRAPAYVLEAQVDGVRRDVIIDLQGLRTRTGATYAVVPMTIAIGDYPPVLRGRSQRMLLDAASLDAALPLGETLNAASETLRIDALDADATGELWTTPVATTPNVPVPLAPGTTLDTLRAQGWSGWTHGDPWPEVEFTAPAFDVLVVGARREVRVWASRWDDGAAVADARAELLVWRTDRTPRVIATATTDADGVAALALPDDVVVEPDRFSSHRWMVRITDASGARAIRPLDFHGHDDGLGSAWVRRGWGVSDRPLYRPGDSLRYRLWQREHRATLATPRASAPVELVLEHSDQSKTITRWTATPTPDGSIDGTLRLPEQLVDGTYCIGMKYAKYGDIDGTCFFVGTHRAQDLWATLASPDRVLGLGERFDLELRSGYYSGGAAADLPIADIEAYLQPMPLGEAFPQHARFSFVDVQGDDIVSGELEGLDDIDARTDINGQVRAPLRVAFEPVRNKERLPPFGVIEISAGIEPDGREGTTASTRTTRVALFDRYVGLSLDPSWPNASTPVRAEAIVIDSQGRVIRGARVEVTVEFLGGGYGTGASPLAPVQLASCALQAGVVAACDAPRMQAGRYRWTARSGDAAPAVIDRYIWAGSNWRGGNKDESVEFIEGDVTASATGASVSLPLRQPFARARALVVVRAGEVIVGHRVIDLSQPVTAITLSREPRWPSKVTVQAFVREQAASTVSAGVRTPPKQDSDSVDVEWPQVEAPPPVELGFKPATGAPGTRVALTVRNTGVTSREVTLSVMDDALRSLGARWVAMADPKGDMWLGDERRRRSNDFWSFNDWKGAAWSFEGRRIGAPAAFKDAAAKARQRADVSFGYRGGASEGELQRIEVTGSRIRRADVESAQPVFKVNDPGARDPSLRISERPSASESAALTAALRVRTRFADTVHWSPRITLAPGATHTIELTLPDNLTRWRAVAWSSGVDDDFHMAEATLESGLPVEARLQAPVRVHVGDRAVLNGHVRHVADRSEQATLQLRAQGEGVDARSETTPSLKPGGQASGTLAVAPTAIGVIDLLATARTGAGGDAVAGSLAVEDNRIATRKIQAAWLDADALSLALPTLPGGASDARVGVTLQPGASAWVERWSADLREYVHRCWEQMLSRAVAAALAVERQDPAWPDAQAVVDEALRNAGVFQDQHSGGFVYFVEQRGTSLPLTAYSAQALRVLRELGHPVDAHIEAQAQRSLALVAVPRTVAPAIAGGQVRDTRSEALAMAAFAAAERDSMPLKDLDALWMHWPAMSMPVRVATAQALARNAHPRAGAAVTQLLAAAPRRGNRRVLAETGRFDAWMRSTRREQCALIDLLRTHPTLAPIADRRALIAGLGDLYAGGVTSVDTQTGAICLLATRDLASPSSRATHARVELGNVATSLVLEPGAARAEWGSPLAGDAPLRIARTGDGDVMPVSVIATLDYREDASEAQASAVGFALQRRHAVLRNGDWQPVGAQALRIGDWVRTTLVLDTAAPRHFVALTDAVAGGQQPTDLQLDGIAGVDLERASDTGSGAFETRKLDPRAPKFYATYLPAGRHEVHYFARVANAGDYLAAPAVAELMYGSATRARSDGVRVRIDE